MAQANKFNETVWIADSHSRGVPDAHLTEGQWRYFRAMNESQTDGETLPTIARSNQNGAVIDT